MQVLASLKDLADLLRIDTRDENLVREQVNALEKQIPWLYLNLLINAAALSYTHYGSAPAFLTIWPLTFMTVLFVARMIFWFTPSKKVYTHETGIKRLKSLWLLGTIVGVVYNAWGLQMLPYGNAFQQGHVAFFFAVTTIGCLYSLVQFPPLTLTLLGTSVLNMAVYVAIKGNEIQAAMAISYACIIVIIAFIGRILYRNYFFQIKTKYALSESQNELEKLNEELVFHRDNLTEEVRKRTQQLEEALQAERKLNELQNEFVSMVSHEFRTPLTIIDGTARRVQRRFDKMSTDDVFERIRIFSHLCHACLA